MGELAQLHLPPIFSLSRTLSETLEVGGRRAGGGAGGGSEVADVGQEAGPGPRPCGPRRRRGLLRPRAHNITHSRRRLRVNPPP